jgi:hypothetical protein
MAGQGNAAPRCGQIALALRDRIWELPAKVSETLHPIEQRAAAGSIPAQIELARSYALDGRHDLARGWFARAAQAGDAGALGQLAMSLLKHPPQNIPEGMGMIRAAAERGDAAAMLACAGLASQDGDLPERWRIAHDYLRRAAGLGSRAAHRQQQALAADDRLAMPPVRTISEAPRIAVCEGFARPEACDWLIERARPDLQAAKVYDPSSGGGLRAEGMRSNSTASFAPPDLDVVFNLLRDRMALWTGLSIQAMEPAAVLHYAPGEQFAPHFDFIDPANPQLAENIARHGQRLATVLVYLNDGYEAGETDFPGLGFRFRGRKGDALLFWNVDPSGVPDPKTLHAGLAPTSGEKWLLSQWIRG